MSNRGTLNSLWEKPRKFPLKRFVVFGTYYGLNQYSLKCMLCMQSCSSFCILYILYNLRKQIFQWNRLKEIFISKNLKSKLLCNRIFTTMYTRIFHEQNFIHESFIPLIFGLHKQVNDHAMLENINIINTAIVSVIKIVRHSHNVNLENSGVKNFVKLILQWNYNTKIFY